MQSNMIAESFRGCLGKE